MSTSQTIKHVTSLELLNLLQAQSNWPAGGAPAVFDLRSSGKRIIRGSHRVLLKDGEVEVNGASQRSWRSRDICLYDASPDGLDDHPVARELLRSGACRELFVLSDPFDDFEKRFPFLCAKESSSKASKRPLIPSCIIPNLLYLGDLSDAAALPRLREQINIQTCVTALAELTPSLKAAVQESGVKHVWCNVRDVEEANIKEHFATAYEQIETSRKEGSAVFVHCSRGVSRSASLCIAYLMKKESWSASQARSFVHECRPIILPNDGFWRCLQEFEKEMKGERSGVYAPAPKTKTLEDLDFELPPEWAAEPTHTSAALAVEKGSELVETLACGDNAFYTFGRSLTCDFPLEHPSISRNHAAIIHHENGGLYVVDLKSSHGTHINGKTLKPFEAALLRNGAHVSFGASTRTYTLQGAAAPLPPPPSDSDRHGGSSSSSAAAGPAAGPLMPGEERKRKYTPADNKKRKVNKWLKGEGKSRSQMTENERVAMGAGSGSGCFGPGFD